MLLPQRYQDSTVEIASEFMLSQLEVLSTSLSGTNPIQIGTSQSYMRHAVTVDFIRHSFQSLLTTKLGGHRESGVMSVVTRPGQILPFSLFMTHLITSLSNFGTGLCEMNLNA